MAANTNAETPLGSLPEDPKIAAGPAAPNASEAVDAARKHEEAAKAAKEAQDAEERARLKALGQAAAPTRGSVRDEFGALFTKLSAVAQTLAGGIQRAFEWIIGGWVFTVDVVPANIQVPCLPVKIVNAPQGIIQTITTDATRSAFRFDRPPAAGAVIAELCNGARQ